MVIYGYRIFVEFGQMDDEIILDDEINPLNLTARDLINLSDAQMFLPRDANGNLQWHNIHLFLEPAGEPPIFMPLDNTVFNQFPENDAIYHFQIQTTCTRCGELSSIQSLGANERICYACHNEEYFDDTPYSENEEESSAPHTPRNQGIEVSIPNAPRRVSTRERNSLSPINRRALDFCAA